MSGVKAPGCCSVSFGGSWAVVARPWGEVAPMMRERSGDGWLMLPVVTMRSGEVDVDPVIVRRRAVWKVGAAEFADAEQAMNVTVAIREAYEMMPSLFGAGS